MLNHSLALLLADTVPGQPDADEPSQHGGNEEKIVSTHSHLDFTYPRYDDAAVLGLSHTHINKKVIENCKPTHTGLINTAVQMANSAGFG